MIKAQLAINRYSPIDFFLHYFFMLTTSGLFIFTGFLSDWFWYFDCFKKYWIILLGLSYCMCFSPAELCLISALLKVPTFLISHLDNLFFFPLWTFNFFIYCSDWYVLFFCSSVKFFFFSVSLLMSHLTSAVSVPYYVMDLDWNE